LVIKSGQIVEKGEADNLYNNPQHPYTQKLISSIPDLPTI
jgi:oligopeptide/dipeptide ABC transporter ATP-binding protein